MWKTLLSVVLCRVVADSRLRGQPVVSQTAPREITDAEDIRAPVTVRLRRLLARTGSVVEGFYVGEISVGEPELQKLSVLFDTASGQVILPSATCQSAACSTRRLYDPKLSRSAVSVDSEGVPRARGANATVMASIEFAQVDLGSGEVTGDFMQDVVCMAAGFCTRVGVVAAVQMTDTPFGGMPHDGIVGLGMDGLSFGGFNFLGLQGLPRQFALTLRGDAGFLTFGGLDSARPPARPFQWVPVDRPAEGYWQVRIRSVRVGNRTVDACTAGCRGIVDTGASFLGVPVPVMPKLQATLTSFPAPGVGCLGESLHLDLDDATTLTLRPADYAGVGCTSLRMNSMIALQSEPGFDGVFVLGETVLRRYDTVFDAASKRIGFALASPQAVRIGPPTQDAAERHVGGSPTSKAEDLEWRVGGRASEEAIRFV